jgi:predicted metal-binding transcription factor (methanogenesis marker protein 9)
MQRRQPIPGMQRCPPVSCVCRRLQEAAACEREIRAAQAELSEARAQLAARSAEVCGHACLIFATVPCSCRAFRAAPCHLSAQIYPAAKRRLALPLLNASCCTVTALQVEAHAEIVSRAEHEAARVAEERQQLAGRAAELAARVRALQPRHVAAQQLCAGRQYVLPHNRPNSTAEHQNPRTYDRAASLWLSA